MHSPNPPPLPAASRRPLSADGTLEVDSNPPPRALPDLGAAARTMGPLLEASAPLHKAVAKPPTFSGKEATAIEINRFIFLLVNYLAILRILPGDQVAVAITFLTGATLDWAMDQPAFESFESFKRQLSRAFAPYNHNMQARHTLRSTTQTGTVTSYVNSFRQACMLVHDLSPAERLDRFLTGLKPSVRHHLLTYDVQTFDEAAAMATRLDISSTFYSTPTTPAPAPSPKPHPSPSPRLNAASTSSITPTSGPKPPITPEQRDELNKVGGCVYCRKTDHNISTCPTLAARNAAGKGRGAQ